MFRCKQCDPIKKIKTFSKALKISLKRFKEEWKKFTNL